MTTELILAKLPKNTDKYAYLLSDKVFCGDCGSNWVGVSSRKNELSYNWYRCKEYLNHQKCKVPGIKSTLLEEIIIEATCNFLKSKMSMDMMAKSIYEEQGKKSPLLQSMENDYKDTSEKMKNILSAIEKGADFSMLQERYKALEVTKRHWKPTSHWKIPKI